MFELLEKLRQKPRRERKAIAVGVAGGITVVIFALWAISFTASLGTSASLSERGDAERLSSFGSFLTAFKGSIEPIQESLRDAGTQLERFRAGAPEETPTQGDAESGVEDVPVEESAENTNEPVPDDPQPAEEGAPSW